MFRSQFIVRWITLLAILFGLTGSIAQADPTSDDMSLLGLMFRNSYGPYSQKPDALPEVKEIANGAGGRGGAAGSVSERYALLTKGIAMMVKGKWNEGIEASTIMDMRLPGKVFEPGETVKVKLGPIIKRAEPFKEHYMVDLQLATMDGKTIGEKKSQHFDDMSDAEVGVVIPKDLAAGEYAMQYTFNPHHNPGPEPILKGRRAIWVIPGGKARIEALGKKAEEIKQSKVGEKSERQGIAAQSVAWYADTYKRSLTEDIPGVYTGSPIFMLAIRAYLNPETGGVLLERIDYVKEIKLAEDLAAALAKGEDPLAKMTGDMRLAYKSTADGEIIPFRIYVPKKFDASKKSPLAIALHGAGGDENSFMDRYDGLYIANAEKRGYIAVSVNGRGAYGGYRGNSGKDPLEVMDLVAKIYPIDMNRVYLMGHSMGGMGTVLVGFDNANRFAALAPIAGYGAATQLDKAKDMPIILSQGDEDALVPVGQARAFNQAAQERKMEVKYIEKKGVEHLSIPIHVMNDIFDWFDSHPKKTAAAK